MESDWRWNVFEMGWSQSKFELLSRAVGFPDVGIGKWLGPLGPEVGFLIFNPATGFYEFNGTTTLPFPGAHYPYGYNVEPD